VSSERVFGHHNPERGQTLRSDRGAGVRYDSLWHTRSRGDFRLTRRVTPPVGHTDGAHVRAPFWFPLAGDYVEELEGGGLGLTGIRALEETWLLIPSNYGRIWTRQTG